MRANRVRQVDADNLSRKLIYPTHALGYTISGVFFGIYMLLLGQLIFRSGFLPRIVGVLMAIGGLGNLVDSFTTFLLPTLAARLPDLGMLGGIAELALCLWLMTMGVNASRWEEKANARQI